MPEDVAGMRKALAESGIGIGGFYAAETFGNPSSGFKQGATYDGVLELHLDGDLKKWGLWKGLCLHANGYQIHGRSITTHRKAIVVGVENFGDDDGAVCSGIGGPAAVPAARSRFRCRPLRSIACSSRVGVNLMNPVTSH